MPGRLYPILFFGILFPVAYSPIHGILLNLIGHKVFYSAPKPPPIFPRHIFSKTFFKACRLLRINKHDTLQPKQKMGKPERNAFFLPQFCIMLESFLHQVPRHRTRSRSELGALQFFVFYGCLYADLHCRAANLTQKAKALWAETPT